MLSAEQLTAFALAGALLLAKSAGVVCVGAVASRLLAQSAAHRVYAWRLTFLCLLGLPIAQVLLPQVDLALVGVDHARLAQSTGVGALSTSIAGWLVLLWTIGAGFSLLRLVRDIVAARALCQRAMPVLDDRMTRLSDAMARASGTARVGLRLTAELDAPALIGWRHPIVLLPLSAVEWSTLELRSVLCHELEHVGSRDWLVMLLERVIGTIYWMNPLVLLARMASSADREWSADNAVLRAAVEPQVYAGQLLRTARGRARPQVALSLAFANYGVEARVRALFSAAHSRGRVSLVARVAIMTLMLPMALAASTVRPWTCLPPHAHVPARTN